MNNPTGKPACKLRHPWSLPKLSVQLQISKVWSFIPKKKRLSSWNFAGTSASEPHLSNTDKIKNAGERPIQRLWTVPPRVGCFWSSQSKYSKVFFAVSTVLTKLLLFLRSTLQIGPFISNNLHSACTQLNPIDWLAIQESNLSFEVGSEVGSAARQCTFQNLSVAWCTRSTQGWLCIRTTLKQRW